MADLPEEPSADAGDGASFGAPTPTLATAGGGGAAILRSAMTPWLLLVIGVAVALGLYATSVRSRDRALARADRATVADAKAATRQLVAASAALARDAAPDAFTAGRIDETALRSFVDSRRLAIQFAGASGIAALLPTGPDGFDYVYMEPSGLGLSGQGSRDALGVDPAALATVARGGVALTNIFTGPGVGGASAPTPILAVLAPPTKAGAATSGFVATLLNPDVLATEVVKRIDGVHGFAIDDGNDKAPLVTDWASAGTGRPAGLVSRTASMRALGRRLDLRLLVSPASEDPQLSHARDLLLGFGICVSFLVFAIAQLARRNERRAARRVHDATKSLAASEQRFRVLVNEQSDVIIVIDHGLRIRWANPTATRVLGWELDDFVGREGLDLVHPDDRAKTVDSFAVLIGPVDDPDPLEIRVQHADGSYVPMEVNGADLSEEPTIGGIVINLRDLTERRAVEDELAEARARFQVAFEQAPIGIKMSGPDGVIVRVNSSFAEMLGWTPDQLVGVNSATIVAPDDAMEHADALDALAQGRVTRSSRETRYLHADGHVVWTSVSAAAVLDANGGVRYVISQIEDITERRAIAERIAHQAIHDPMTGLPNRTVFLERLRVALDSAADKGTRVGVLFCDLDHFKWINDTYGHATGDQVLAAVGDRLRACLRPADSVARFGGDEFTILCTDLVDEPTLLTLAQRVHEVIAEPFPLPDGDAYLSPSVGAALSGPGHDTAEVLLRDADTAMYEAKASGRACTVMFSADDHGDGAVASLRTGNALHVALERGEFRVYFQALTNFRTGKVVGTESLVRWEHPERGIVDPNDFVPLAEETGLIVPIGRWVLEEACRQTVEWQRRLPPDEALSVTVNLSPRQLSDPALASDVAAIIARTGIDPNTLWLEITESALMHDAESAVSALRALRAQGVHLAVDDFGTGYSSLQYLKRFPVEALKVDRSFVDGLGREPEDSAIVGAVIGLARSLNLLCVAEGVESIEQVRELQRLECDLGQGFLLGRPQSAADHAPYPRPTMDLRQLPSLSDAR